MPLLPDDDSETDDSLGASHKYRAHKDASPGESHFPFNTTFDLSVYYSKYSNCEIRTTLSAHRDPKWKRHIDDLDDHSEKENVPTISIIPTPSIGNAKRPRKDQKAVTLLRNAVILLQKAVVLSQEAISMLEKAVGLLDSEN